jgi:hypothetical protein
MARAWHFDDEDSDNGLTGAAIQEAARRQLAVSIAVAAVIVLGLGLAALTPASHGYADATPHKIASVQQPTFMSLSDRVASAKRYAPVAVAPERRPTITQGAGS